MWGQSVDLEHSLAAGNEAVTVLLGVCAAIVVAGSLLSNTIAGAFEAQASLLSRATAQPNAPVDAAPAPHSLHFWARG